MTRKDYENLVEVILDTEHLQGKNGWIGNFIAQMTLRFPNFDRDRFEYRLKMRRDERGYPLATSA